MNYSVSKNRDGIFWSLIFRDRRNRDGKFPSLFPSLFSIRDGIPSLFSVFILQFSCSVELGSFTNFIKLIFLSDLILIVYLFVMLLIRTKSFTRKK